MRYRIVKDIGDSDYPPGATVDPVAAGWGTERVKRLVDQRFIEPVREPRVERVSESAGDGAPATAPRRRGQGA